MCQTAAPGNVTVGKPAAWARRPNSLSSHLMNIGSESPISSSTWRGIRHMNQPLKSTSARLCSQRAERRLRAAKSHSV